MGATGVVLRDDRGVLVARSSCGIAHVPDTSTAEARALRDRWSHSCWTGWLSQGRCQ